MRNIFIFLLAFIAFRSIASVNVSGGIFTNTTWTEANSPYIIVGDVAVDSAVTLTIEPGVQVRFNGKYYFFVDGKMIAAGTVTDSILFTSNKTTPASKDWWGLTFRPKGKYDTSIMRYCIVEYSNIGIYVDGCSPKISNSLIINNWIGIDIHPAASAPQNHPYILNNKVTMNSNSGIGISGGTGGGEIIGNEVTQSYYVGIQCNGTNWKIINNTISYNNGVGLTCSASNGFMVSGNTISYNGTGLTVGLTNGGVVTGNTIMSNSTTGASISGNNGSFTNNLIVYNSTGLAIQQQATLSVNQNTVAFNDIGLQYGPTSSSQVSTVQYNCISANTSYNHKVTAAADISVANNWWGTTTTGTIDAFIYDFYDNVLLGKALYTPVLTSASGCQSVSPPAPCVAPSITSKSSSSPTSETISWQPLSGAGGYEYYVIPHNTTAPLTGTITNATSVSLNGLANNQLYDFCIRSRCTASPYYSSWTCDTFRIALPPCPAPLAIQFNFVWYNNMTVSWDSVPGNKSYEYYVAEWPSIPPANATPTNNSTIFVNGLTANTKYDLCVRTKCGNQYSPWTCDTVTTPKDLGIEKTSGNFLRTFPNPARNLFTIESAFSLTNADITITNMMGTVVYNGKMNGIKQDIDMSSYQPGLYFIKCNNGKGSQTIKLMKE